MSKTWRFELFGDYCTSIFSCCYGTFLCPCAAASIKTQFDGSSWWYNLWWLCMPVPTVTCFNYPLLRNYVRRGYDIEGNASHDGCTSICCTPCVLVQLLNEVSERGTIDQHQTYQASRDYTGLDVVSDNTLCDMCMIYSCGCCEVAHMHSILFDMPIWFSLLFPMSICQLYHVVRMKYGIPSELYSNGSYFTGALLDQNLHTEANDSNNGVSTDVKFESQVSNCSHNSLSNVHVDMKTNDVITLGNDWSIDCKVPYCANVWPFVNCIWYYQSIRDIKKYYM